MYVMLSHVLSDVNLGCMYLWDIIIFIIWVVGLHEDVTLSHVPLYLSQRGMYVSMGPHHLCYANCWPIEIISSSRS